MTDYKEMLVSIKAIIGMLQKIAMKLAEFSLIIKTPRSLKTFQNILDFQGSVAALKDTRKIIESFH